MWMSNTLKSEAETPDMLDAAASVRGLSLLSFSRDSAERDESRL